MTQGNFPEVSKTRIYSIASTVLGIGAFTADSSQNTSNNAAMDAAWNDFFTSWVVENRVKDFIREDDLSTRLVDGQGSVDADSLVIPYNFTNAFVAPQDMMLPLEVEFREEYRGIETYRWQWAIVSYETSSVHNQARCIVTDAASPIRVKFVFFPNDGGDTAYEGQVNPTTATAAGYAFAEYLAASFGKSLPERQAIGQAAREKLLMAKVIDGQTGSRRRKRPGDLINVRNVY